MSERITKVQRWLDLVAFLVGRRVPVTVDEIMEGVPSYAERWRAEESTARASVRRTFERDKDELREIGIAIETIRFTINYGLEELDGYRIARRDFYLPYLELVERSAAESRRWADANRVAGVELAEDEARAALDALRRVSELPSSPLTREARTAFRKLAFDLDPDHFAPAPVLYAERPGTGEILETLRTLSDALLARKEVRFHYHGIYRGHATDRAVAPYGLFFQ
jgi:proteasome accessory factor B